MSESNPTTASAAAAAAIPDDGDSSASENESESQLKRQRTPSMGSTSGARNGRRVAVAARAQQHKDFSYLLGPGHPLWTGDLDDANDDANDDAGDHESSSSGDTGMFIPTGPHTRRHTQATKESPRSRRATPTPNHHANARQLQTIPILELPGVVLFPNASIPLRIRDPALREYLGRQINESRLLPQKSKPITIGILTQRDAGAVPDEEEDGFLRDRMHDLLMLHGILLRNNRGNTRRSRLTMSGMVDRLRDLRGGGGFGSRTEQQRGQGGIRRGAGTVRLEDDFTHRRMEDHSDSDADDSSDAESRTPPTSSRRPQPPSRPRHPFVGRVGTIATITSTHNDSILDDDRADATDATHNQGRQQRQHGSSNRHATTAISSPSTSTLWQIHDGDSDQRISFTTPQLVVTAVGTNQFTIIEGLPQSSFAGLKLFQVEPFGRQSNHRAMRSKSYPSIVSNPTSTSTSNNAGHFVGPSKRQRQHRLAWNLCLRSSSIPYHAYLRHGQSILLHEVHSLWEQYIAKNCATSDQQLQLDEESSKDPDAFTFRLASALPFSQTEKLQVLYTSTVVERLQFLQSKLQEMIAKELKIHCGVCDTALALASDVFAVGPDSASSGNTPNHKRSTDNYVNAHGHNHQITTVRKLLVAQDRDQDGDGNNDGDDDEDPFPTEDDLVVLVGDSCTDNSYFPGYGWTITYCRFCSSLLGWKFLPSSTSPPHIATQDRPDSFFAFQSSSITSHE